MANGKYKWKNKQHFPYVIHDSSFAISAGKAYKPKIQNLKSEI